MSADKKPSKAPQLRKTKSIENVLVLSSTHQALRIKTGVTWQVPALVCRFTGSAIRAQDDIALHTVPSDPQDGTLADQFTRGLFNFIPSLGRLIQGPHRQSDRG